MIRETLRRWPALLMLAVMLSMPVTVLAYGLDDGWSPLRRGVIEPEGWRGGPLEDLIQDTMQGDDSLLRMLDHIGAMPETANVPVQSHVLGLAVPPQALPGLYEAEALSSSTPLRTAVIAYNAGLDLMDANELLASPDLRMADDLPFDAQVAIAVLLYALTDASLLQKQAVSGLSPEDFTALMGLPGMILSGRLDPTDGSEAADEDFAQAYGLLSQVDKQRIDEAALIMVHSVSHAMPSLRDWAQREREQAQNPDARVQEIGSLLDQYTPTRIAGMDPIERLDILADTLRMASTFQDVDVSPYLRPLPAPEGDTPLRDAILDLAGVLEASGLPLGDLVEERELRRADALPRSMQVAVARIVTNQAAVVQATIDLNDAVEAIESSIDPAVLADPDALTDPDALPDIPSSQRDALLAALGDLRHAEIRTVLAVQQGAPTLEAWGLHWAREPSMLPATPAHAPAKLSDAAAMAGAMADPAASLQEVMHLAGQARGIHADAAEAPLPPRGSLADSVFELYDRLGVEATPQQRDDIRQGALSLHPVVEQNTARILVAQLDALDALANLEASLSVEDRIAMGRGAAALDRLQAGEVSLGDVQAIRAHYEVLDRIESTYLGAAAGLAAAMDAASREMGDYADGVTGYRPVEEKSTKSKSWYAKAWSVVSSIQVIGTASAQSTPMDPVHIPPVCPDSPLADCGNDVWFMDPLLETVVVSGFGETRFDLREMEKDWRRPDVPQDNRGSEAAAAIEPMGQLLTVDLGGDDVYRNNAGGSFPLTVRAEDPPEGAGQPIILKPAAVALDLGGDDRYLPAPSYEAVQGAAVAGIGVLYDRRGDDQYTATRQAQGSASAPGSFAIGVLLDGDGEDRYVADDFAQGSARGPGVGLLIDRAGIDHYTLSGNASHPATGQGGAEGGLGLLIDGEGRDTYSGGMQGQGTDGGIGVFVDLQGDDEHGRTHDDENETAFGDGECWTSLRAPPSDPFHDTNRSAGNATTFAGQAPEGSDGDPQDYANATTEQATGHGTDAARSSSGDAAVLAADAMRGHGLFVDTDGGRCTYDPSPLIPAAVAAALEQVDGVLDLVEGINPIDEGYVLRIGGVLALGESDDTDYNACDTETESNPTVGCIERDYVVSIDLGGNNTYRNLAGGVATALTLNLRLPGILVNVDREGHDRFQNSGSCVQACNAILIDLGGDDTYEAQNHAQGVSTSLGHMSGVLFDAGGDDQYIVASTSGIGQGGVSGTAFGVGVLLDMTGADRYQSPSQGTVNSPVMALVNAFYASSGAGGAVGMFGDLGGDDTYRPVGRQGEMDFFHNMKSNKAVCCSAGADPDSKGAGLAAFVDAQGEDHYLGTVDQHLAPDFSSHRNNRLDAQSHLGISTVAVVPGTSLFWDLARDDPEKLAGVASALQSGEAGSFHMGPLGIAVGTPGTDLLHEDYTLFLDPGGNDVYRNNAGATRLRVAHSIDDSPGGGWTMAAVAKTTYAPQENYPFASLHIDFDGEDRYELGDDFAPHETSALHTPQLGGILTQGAGFLGIGILVDEAGNPAAVAAGFEASRAADDSYTARAMSQGFGLYGWGILWDRQGDDTYRYDPVVVQRPVIEDDVVAWLQLENRRTGLLEAAPTSTADVVSGTPGVQVYEAKGAQAMTWQMHLKGPLVSSPCRLNDVGGGPFHGLAVSSLDGMRFTVSRLDPAEGLWAVYHAQLPNAMTVQDPCAVEGFTPIASWGGNTPRSNQVNPQFASINGGSVMWQDDRDGTWSLYHKKLTESQDNAARPLGLLKSPTPGQDWVLGAHDPTHDPRSSNQTAPHVAGSWVVYEDDRDADEACPHARSIHRYNWFTGAEQRLSPDGCAVHAKPRMSQDFVVWQTADVPEGPWDVTVYKIPLGDQAAESRRLAQEGDQFDPVVAGGVIDGRVLYTDAADGRHEVMQYFWDSNTSRVERTGAIQPALDRTHPSRAAWVDTTGQAAGVGQEVGSDYWEVYHKELRPEAQPEVPGLRQSVASGTGSQWLQGASYAHGRGILLEEGGTDTYVGDRFAQGTAASLVGPKDDFQTLGPAGVIASAGFPTVDLQGDTDAYGVLVDADGNDGYTARSESQGVHFAREITAVVTDAQVTAAAGAGGILPIVPIMEVEAMASVGLLLDLRGNDAYMANLNSQGYGALTTGAGTTSCPLGLNINSPCNPLRLYLVQSYGLFMDLGGLDNHRYGQQMYQKVSLEDDYCRSTAGPAFSPVRSLALNDTAHAATGAFPIHVNGTQYGANDVEQTVEDPAGLMQTLNETFDRTLWSYVAEALGDDAPEQVRQELEQTAFEAVEKHTNDLLDEILAICQEQQEDGMKEKDSAEEFLTNERPQRCREEEVGECRNNHLWRQKTRLDGQGRLQSGDVEGTPCDVGPTSTGTACGIIFHAGGIGMDLPLMDFLNRALTTGANRLIETSLDVVVEDEDGEDDPLRGWVTIRAEPSFNQSLDERGFRFDEAEFFSKPGDTVFQLLGTVDKPEDDSFQLRWDTDSEDYPDATYDLRVRVHYTHESFGFNLGYAEKQIKRNVDNLPRILSAGVPFVADDDSPTTSLSAFSPSPYASEDRNGLPRVTFRISGDLDQEPDQTPGHDSWARVDVLDAKDQTVATIFNGTVAEDQVISEVWAGTYDSNGTAVPSGRYTIRINTTDRDPAQSQDRTRTIESNVSVYSSTPHSACVRLAPDASCNQEIVLNTGSGSVQSGVLRQTLYLTAQPGARGAAPADLESIDRYHVRFGRPDGSGGTDWKRVETVAADPRGDAAFQLEIEDGETWHVMALAQDRAGNLECNPGCHDRVSDALLSLNGTFNEKEKLSVFPAWSMEAGKAVLATLTADLDPPKMTNRKLFVDEQDVTKSPLPPRVGKNSNVTITYQVTEENQPPIPVLDWTLFQPPFPRDETGAGATVVSDGVDANGRPRYNVSWQGWPDLVADDASWTEGVVSVTLDAKDVAGNTVQRATPASFDLLLDRKPPTIHDIEVRYPGGRSHAEAGDEVTLLVHTTDPVLNMLETPASLFRLDLDVSDLGDAGVGTGAPEADSCKLLFEPGVCFVPLGKKGAWKTVIPIESVPEGLRAHKASVTINVTDAVGNTNSTVKHIVLGAPGLGPELVEQEIRVYGANLTWKTAVDTDAYLVYGEGTTTDDLTKRLNSTVGQRHEFNLTGLDGGTPHVYRFFAVDPESGAVEPGSVDPILFRTLHGLTVDLQRPSAASGETQVLSGLYRIEGDGWVQSVRDANLTAEPRVVMRLHGPGLPADGRPIFDGLIKNETFGMDLVTDALQDGVHSLDVTVSYLGEEATTTVERLLVDNTAPLLSFADPLHEARLRVVPDRILVRATENLTDIDGSSVRLHVNGRPVNTDVAFTPDGEAHHGVIEITDIPRLRAGILHLEVFAQDMARNPGHASIKVLYDPDAPAAAADVQYPDGQQAARPGQWITIRVADPGDAAGVARVTADATALDGGDGLGFLREGDGHVLELPVPTSHEEGTYALPVEVVDGAGNVREVVAQIVVDTSLPAIASVDPLPLDPHRAVVELNASEPVTVVVEALAYGVATVRAVADELASLHVLELAGLQAGAEYDVTVMVRDRAGNEASATQTWPFQPQLGDVPAVSNLTASATPDRVRLEWDDVGDGFRYAVHRAQDGTFETVAVATTASYTDRDVEAGAYRYFVQALDPRGRHGAPSQVVDVQVPAPDVDQEGISVSVHPTTGVAGQTEFVFKVRLQGAREAEPSTWLVINDGSRRMSKDAGEDCRESCTFRHATTLGEVDLRDPTIDYHIEVFDASGATRMPTAGGFEGPEVLARDGIYATQEEQTPGPAVLLIMAVLAIVLLIRRRNPL